MRADFVVRAAQVTLSQRFVDIEQRPVEAVYRFPLPESVAMCGYRVRFLLATTISPRQVPVGATAATRRPVDTAVNPDVALDVPYGLRLLLDVHDGDRVESVASPFPHVSGDLAGPSIFAAFVAGTVDKNPDLVLDVTYQRRLEHRGYRFAGPEESCAQHDLALPEPAEQTPAKQREVFIIDRSGSMSGTTMQQAAQMPTMLLRSFPEGVRFNLSRFSRGLKVPFARAVPYTAEVAGQWLAVVETVPAVLGGTGILRPGRH